MKRWNQKESAGTSTSYACIEQFGESFESMVVVTNGASWAVDPATIDSHASFEEAAKELGLTAQEFEEVEL